MTERTTQEQWAWEAGEDPVQECRRCGEIYSEFALDYRPGVGGCPNCYEEEPASKKRFQFVWWWPLQDWSISWGRWLGGMRLIYRWSVQVGPLEIRRWEVTP